MKKIIGGKRYDTDSARLVGEWSNGYGRNDFAYVIESLYCKRTGEYFLHGEGGASSRYARSCGQNMWSGGEHIMPLSYEEARDWAEHRLEADEYEAEFDVIPDSEETVVLSVRVSAEAKTVLDRMVAQTGRQKGELVTEAILALR